VEETGVECYSLTCSVSFILLLQVSISTGSLDSNVKNSWSLLRIAFVEAVLGTVEKGISERALLYWKSSGRRSKVWFQGMQTIFFCSMLIISNLYSRLLDWFCSCHADMPSARRTY